MDFMESVGIIVTHSKRILVWYRFTLSFDLFARFPFHLKFFLLPRLVFVAYFWRIVKHSCQVWKNYKQIYRRTHFDLVIELISQHVNNWLRLREINLNIVVFIDYRFSMGMNGWGTNSFKISLPLIWFGSWIIFYYLERAVCSQSHRFLCASIVRSIVSIEPLNSRRKWIKLSS